MTISEMVAGVAPAHQPVLLQETVAHLLALDDISSGRVQQPGIVVDATFGRGGHSLSILDSLPETSRVIGLDRDPEAMAQGLALAAADPRLLVRQARFSELAQVLQQLGIAEVQGVLMDIGVSSPQLDDARRGFSFNADGPLDMRMNPEVGDSAADWLNREDESKIAQIIWMYGEERHARRIAKSIVALRPLYTTLELVQAVSQALPKARGPQRKHPATKTFQAIRMFINEELDELEQGLHQGFHALAVGGRLAVITFHSLEDRKVKHAFRQLSQPPKMPRRLPMRHLEDQVPGRLVCGPIKASLEEQTANPRSRSATLRVIERVRRT